MPDHECTDPSRHYRALSTFFLPFGWLIINGALSCDRSHPIQNRMSGFTASKCIPFPHTGYVVFRWQTTKLASSTSIQVRQSWISAYRQSLFHTVPGLEVYQVALFAGSPNALVVRDLPMHCTLNFHLDGITRLHHKLVIGHQKYPARTKCFISQVAVYDSFLPDPLLVSPAVLRLTIWTDPVHASIPRCAQSRVQCVHIVDTNESV